MKEKIIYGIFTKPIHVEKIVNYLNQYTDISYVISTRKDEIHSLKFDVGISYCFPHIININHPIEDVRTWYNYHPAPLPEYPGIYNYAEAIKNKVTEYGVTLHRMTMKVDGGNIIEQKRFNLYTAPTSVNELGCLTHYFLFQLFKETINTLGVG